MIDPGLRDKVDILVNNAAEYVADTFLPSITLGKKAELWEDGPTISTIDVESHDRHFAVNSRAVAILMSMFVRRIIERQTNWGRIINISADCAWGCPKEISYRASKHALESYSRSAAAELGLYGITVNAVAQGPVQSGYISPEMKAAFRILEIIVISLRNRLNHRLCRFFNYLNLSALKFS